MAFVTGVLKVHMIIGAIFKIVCSAPPEQSLEWLLLFRFSAAVWGRVSAPLWCCCQAGEWCSGCTVLCWIAPHRASRFLPLLVFRALLRCFPSVSASPPWKECLKKMANKPLEIHSTFLFHIHVKWMSHGPLRQFAKGKKHQKTVLTKFQYLWVLLC